MEKVVFTDGSLSSSAPPTAITDTNASLEQIDENTTNGISVGITASTTDPDGDAITYTLTDNAGGRFAIDATTGVVTVANAGLIDYETATSHTITVRAVDSTGQYAAQSYTIQVINGNDAPTAPTDSNAATNTVAEGAASGTVVGITAASTDPNAGDTLTYSLANDAGGRFAIDAATGVVTVANGAMIDYETATSHQITVQVSDGGLSRSTIFTVAVTNVSDNPTWTGTAGNDAFTASTPDNWTLSGLSGDDTVTANSGNDILTGGAGNDALNGGAGTNQYLVSGTGDGFDAITGGTGTDTIAATSDGTVIGLRSLSGVEAITAGGYTGVTISGDAGANVLNLSAVTLTGITQILGGAGADVITGNAVANTLAGNAGDDTLDGGAGDDTFLFTGPGDGFDAITGGLGTDVIAATADGTVIGLRSLSGVEAITAGGFSNVSIVGSSGAESFDFTAVALTGIAQIDGGVGNDTIRGTAGSDVLLGGAGADSLYGQAGADILTGGAANDIIDAGDGDDVIRVGVGDGVDTVAGGLGTDRIEATADNTVFGLSSISGVEAITAGGFAGVSISGSTVNDTLDFSIVALTGITKIDGDAGNDIITGTTNADTIIGNVGDDTLNGGAGDDTFQVSGTGHGSDSVNGGAGTDQIVAMASGTVIGLSALSGIEAISAGGFTGVFVQGSTLADTFDFSTTTLTGITRIDGGSGNDTITGSSGDDVIVGGAGTNTLNGGAGDDTFQVGQLAQGFDALAGGTGMDTIQATFTSAMIGLSALSGIESITANGFTGVYIQGSANADVLDFSAVTLTGITRIDGGAGNDTITGNSGNDVIAGGAGNDMLAGGAGDDTFQFGATTQDYDNVAGGAGNDQIVATANSTIIGLSALTGIEAISAGSSTNVIIQGSANPDILDFSAVAITGVTRIEGGAGNDTITGSSASDIILGGVGADVLNGGGGIDTVSYSSSTAAVTVNLAVVGQAGGDAQGDQLSGFRNVLGSSFNDLLTGDASDNSLTGGAGNDTLQGGLGNDILDGGGNTDIASYADSTTGVSVDLGTGILGGGAAGDTLIAIEGVTGSAYDDVLTGDTSGNTLAGGAGNDVLNGKAGSDIMVGNAGDDTYYVDTTTDVVTEAASEGTDQVFVTLISYTLASNVENLGFIGTGAFTGTGNALANSIVGGAGADTFLGGAGKDSLTGGTGADLFRLTVATDSAVGSGADLITDFSVTDGDRMDLATIDADLTLAGDQAFSFVGSAAFSAKGQLRAEFQADGNTHVFGATANTTPAFEIVLAGNITLQASNFIL